MQLIKTGGNVCTTMYEVQCVIVCVCVYCVVGPCERHDDDADDSLLTCIYCPNGIDTQQHMCFMCNIIII